MRIRSILIVCLVPIFLASPAGAAIFENLAMMTNCDSWSLSVDLVFGQDHFADVDYLISLWQDGAVVETVSGRRLVTSDMPYLNVLGSWTDQVCGDFIVTAELHLTSPAGTSDAESTVPSNCPCGVEQEACTFGPGYWKNHPGEWPVEELYLGGATHGQQELLGMLRMPGKGRVMLALARQLIAAMLNVANGADATIQPTIVEANSLLMLHPLEIRFKGPDRRSILELKDELAAYNEQPCDRAVAGKVTSGQEEFGTSAKTMSSPEVPPTSVPTSWGEVKATYR
jgi:hypothetical protein